MTLASDLREFIESLNAHGVEYLIVGGHAVGYHGFPRYTGDVDFFIGHTPENAARTAAALRAFGVPTDDALERSLACPDRILQLGVPPNRVDVLTSISGVEFVDARPAGVDGTLDGLPVRFLGRDDLLRNKRASGRPKDLADAAEIERVAAEERKKVLAPPDRIGGADRG